MKKVAVGLSGGVDSSVAAYLLKKQGHEVVGFFMKNWEDNTNQCTAEQDYIDALAVSEKIGIPLYTFNFTKEYNEKVFKEFISGLKQGTTPNPDILCNKEVKFALFMQKALSLGSTHLATGHYARVTSDFLLQRGVDKNKDQSYFLYTLNKKILSNVIFPIGDYTKDQIRTIAKEAGLPVFDKKDSTGICFIGKRNFSEFISDYLPPTEGTFQTKEGKVLGTHKGAWFYTIGQRKGISLGGPGDAWYVLDKDIERQIVYVGQGIDNKDLFKKNIMITDVTWVGEPPLLPLKCTAKIRYRSLDVNCTIESESGEYIVTFEEPQRAVTPSQSIVFYDKKYCLGGAIIKPFSL